MSRKQPRQKDNPKKIKEAKSFPIVSIKNREFVWNVSKIDRDGQWGGDMGKDAQF